MQDRYSIFITDILRNSLIDFVVTEMNEVGEQNIDDIINKFETKDILPHIESLEELTFDVLERPVIKKWLIQNDIIKRGATEPFYFLSEKGKNIRISEGYSNYMKLEKLKLDKLPLEIADLKNKVNSFKEINCRSKWALGVSIVAAIAAILTVILSALKLMQ